MFKAITFVITAIGFVGCVTFVTRYVVLSNGGWRDSDAGRFFVIVYTNLAMLFLLIMANSVFGNWPGRVLVSMALYLAYVIQVWWPLRLLNEAQRLNKKRKESDR